MSVPRAARIGAAGARRAVRFAAALLCVLAAGCATRAIEIHPGAEARAPRDQATLEAVRTLGRDGDWLVIRGYHATDNLVATVTNKPFSHAGVLDLGRDEVVEAEAQGVHVSSLPAFVAKSHRLLLIRPVWSDAASAAPALAKARSVVGRPYDFLGLVGLNIPDTYYCSELALEIYRPWIRREEILPRPIEPGQLHHWGRILYDSGPLP